MVTPTLRQLDIFAQMIASGSIAECARDLDMRAADVEREIGLLESRLGHRLFDRQGGIVTLTDVGRKTVEAMQMLTTTPEERWEDTHALEPEDAKAPPETEHEVENERRSEQVAPPPAEAQGETITIAAHPAIFGHFQEALSAFEQTNSDVAITLDLDTHIAAQAIPRLARGQVDIAYFYALGEPEDWPTRYAWSEQISLYIGSEHPLAHFEEVAPEDVRSIAPILLAPANPLRSLIEEALSAAGLEGGHAELETDNLYDIVGAVREGRGYFAAFGPMARDFARMSGIRRLPLVFPLPPIDVRQGVSGDASHDGIVSALSDYLFR